MDLIHTDVGLLSKDNANWLYSQNIINSEGSLKDNPVGGITQERVQLYSYFRWIVEDVKSKIPRVPKSINFGINEVIELMSNGEVEVDEYSAHYPKVKSIVESGKRAFVSKQPKSKKTEVDDWDI